MAETDTLEQTCQEPFFPPPIDEIKMDYCYFGCSMQQNRYALPALNILLEHARPARIIEFGKYIIKGETDADKPI